MTPPLDRRSFLAASAATAGGAAALASPALAGAAPADPVFAHGVASGDPLPRRVVLWTRVTPEPGLVPGVGSGPQVSVRWQIARDRAFSRVVDSGVATTGPARDYTVKVDAAGLRPHTDYFYRFVLDGVRSGVGRTRTAPAPDDDPRRLRFGVVSCSNWQAGYFAAYGNLATHDLDAVVHLGDYLYEYAPGEYGAGPENVDVRRHRPRGEIVSLADYRTRHAQYKSDPDLQRLHASAPFVVTWDDHESANDAYRGGAENHTPGAEGGWEARRRRAYRAYDEWQPVRMGPGTAAIGDGSKLYRGLQFGTLASLSMLDLRTYRSKQVEVTNQAGINDPDRTITGNRQLDWLKGRLGQRRVQWKLVGNPVMIAPVQFPNLPAGTANDVAAVTGITDATGPVPAGQPYNTDQWDGYEADRRELFDFLRDRDIPNAVFLTGDIHSEWACELPFDAGSYPATRETVGTEFVCTSVTSNNLDDITGADSTAVEEAFKGFNSHIKHLNFDDHGYSVLDVSSSRVHMDYYHVNRRRRDARSRWSTSYMTIANTGHVVRGDGRKT